MIVPIRVRVVSLLLKEMDLPDSHERIVIVHFPKFLDHFSLYPTSHGYFPSLTVDGYLQVAIV
jgi:hypothetical protein